MKFYRFLLVLVFVALPKLGGATHIIGGEISWTCQGNGSYIFDLIVYRDCNGFDVPTTSETISVWNHQSVNSIQVNYISREDLSPLCSNVSSGPLPFQCGSGSGGGNGVGAVELVLYRSNPVFLSGTPPGGGWVFTFSSFFRSSSISNLANPGNTGITILAKMFDSGANGICNDSSPRFFEPPFVVTCAGSPYSFNPNAYDPDLDSLSFSMATPLDQIITSYNPPSDPSPIAYAAGFSAVSPTPNSAMGAGNQNFALNQNNGVFTFTTVIPGNYVLKSIVQAYRNGVLLSENQVEYQVAVENCAVVNNAPSVIAPFNSGTSFETTVNAGDLVTFDLSALESEFLQNGAPQSAYIYATGAQFANVITDANSGCNNPPCATLNTSVPIAGNPAVTVSFSWQTGCENLIGASGQTQESVPYTFVFRVQDDLCQIPAVQYVTVTINVENSAMPSAPELTCVSVNQNAEVELTWTASSDPGGSFTAYEVHSLQDGLIATINDINTTSFVHDPNSAFGNAIGYYVLAKGGCDGLFSVSSDTLSTIFLEVTNPGTGFADLTWTSPPNLDDLGEYTFIEMQYPMGVWTVIDSVPISQLSYAHEITICDAYLEYRVRVDGSNCQSYSNFDGDQFEDMIPPPIPVIQSVSFDTITGNLTISWNQSPSDDTYGYVIYQENDLGFFVEIDTVWGLNNTFYVVGGPGVDLLSFSVAAFDSCFTDQNPPTYQTSGKAEINTAMILESEVNICDQQVLLSWNPYEGWVFDVSHYLVFVKPENENWYQAADVQENFAQLNLSTGVNYTIVVEAFSFNGLFAFSSPIQAQLELPGAPETHYLSTASVEGNQVAVKYFAGLNPNSYTVRLQKFDTFNNAYADIEERTVDDPIEVFFDAEHKANIQREMYRFLAIDSCGNPSVLSNFGKTILLESNVDQAALTITLQWSDYQGFQAPILNYRIYRSVSGVWDNTPLAVLSPDRRTFVDTVEQLLGASGEFCYYVEAVEGYNSYGFFETSKSNVNCALVEPLIYIPNTITINGANPIFKPVVNLYEVSSYELTILNRWGQPIFRTNDHNLGWNGNNQSGNLVTEGTYVYILRINNGAKTELTRRGHVNVLIAG